MKKFAFFIAVSASVFALSGCVTDTDAEEQDLAGALASHKGLTEQRIVRAYDRKPKTYDYNDGTRELTWRWSESNPYAPIWCELNVTIGPDGKVTDAKAKDSGNMGGLRICRRIFRFT